jgi:Transmembrane adaptor Erv26
MHFPSLFVLLVYVSGYMFLVFAAVCLACGLYYLVELAEEYTTLTKRIIRYVIYGQMAVHALLWSYERFPFVQCAVGALAHAAYFLLLSTFPFINPKSAPFVTSLCFLVVDNVMWFRFFQADVELFYSYRVAPGPAVASFFLLVVWLVPLAFFISLSVNDAVLPNAAAARTGAPVGSPALSDPDRRQKSRNLAVVLLESISRKIRHSVESLSGPGVSRGGDILSSAGRRHY